jgi:hypothetical protein
MHGAGADARLDNDSNSASIENQSAFSGVLPIATGEIDMTAFTENHSDFFYRALVAAVIVAPFLLVVAAGQLPEGLERGAVIVYGHGVVLAAASTALILRAAYAYGFRQALRIAASQRNCSVSA